MKSHLAPILLAAAAASPILPPSSASSSLFPSRTPGPLDTTELSHKIIGYDKNKEELLDWHPYKRTMEGYLKRENYNHAHKWVDVFRKDNSISHDMPEYCYPRPSCRNHVGEI